MAVQKTVRATLQQQEIEAHQLLTQSMNMLHDRIEKTETDFVGHLKKVEDRLDQIVDLTKTVAVLQNQTTQQTDQISEVRAQLRESSSKFDNSISRIHTRLDELTTHQRDKIELASREIDIKLESLKSSSLNAIENIKAQSNATERDFRQWLNRGVGAWVIFVLVVGVAQTGFYRWLDNIEKDRGSVSQVATATANVVEKHNGQIDTITSAVKDQQQQTKRLEQMILDTDRQIEIVRNNIRK